MCKNFMFIILLGVMMSCASVSQISATAQKQEHGNNKIDDGRTAIVLACFGTTEPNGISSIINIQQKVKNAFPNIPVKITFTSNIIRSVWKDRQAEAEKWLSQGIPNEVLYIKGIISTFGELQEKGYTNIIVQPTHIAHMEQYQDLLSYVQAMNSIKTVKTKWKPFKKIAIGRPALGTIGSQYDYHDDMKIALETLDKDVALAKKQKAVLVYMAHGNEHWSTGIYCEAQKMMREIYPDIQTYIGSVEGFPSLDDVVKSVEHAKLDNIVLKPFMIVAGDHAINDMASDEEDSWKSVLIKRGFKVFPSLVGLGSNDSFAEIFVQHIKDTAKDNGIKLKN